MSTLVTTRIIGLTNSLFVRWTFKKKMQLWQKPKYLFLATECLWRAWTETGIVNTWGLHDCPSSLTPTSPDDYFHKTWARIKNKPAFAHIFTRTAYSTNRFVNGHFNNDPGDENQNQQGKQTVGRLCPVPTCPQNRISKAAVEGGEKITSR